MCYISLAVVKASKHVSDIVNTVKYKDNIADIVAELLTYKCLTMSVIHRKYLSSTGIPHLL